MSTLDELFALLNEAQENARRDAGLLRARRRETEQLAHALRDLSQKRDELRDRVVPALASAADAAGAKRAALDVDVAALERLRVELFERLNASVDAYLASTAAAAAAAHHDDTDAAVTSSLCGCPLHAMISQTNNSDGNDDEPFKGLTVSSVVSFIDAQTTKKKRVDDDDEPRPPPPPPPPPPPQISPAAQTSPVALRVSAQQQQQQHHYSKPSRFVPPSSHNHNSAKQQPQQQQPQQSTIPVFAARRRGRFDIAQFDSTEQVGGEDLGDDQSNSSAPAPPPPPPPPPPPKPMNSNEYVQFPTENDSSTNPQKQQHRQPAKQFTQTKLPAGFDRVSVRPLKNNNNNNNSAAVAAATTADDEAPPKKPQLPKKQRAAAAAATTKPHNNKTGNPAAKKNNPSGQFAEDEDAFGSWA